MAILGFFGYALQYAQKINMSVAIVCMVNNTAVLFEHQNNLGVNFTNNNRNHSNSSLQIFNECPGKVSNEKSVVSFILIIKKNVIF